MSYLPENDKARKLLPLFKQVTEYFPKALREITKVSVVNNVRYNPDRDPADINWNRGKSTDQLGSSFRHMLERVVGGRVFENVPEDIAAKTGIERVYVLAENAWRACAALELEIETQEALERKAEEKLEVAQAIEALERKAEEKLEVALDEKHTELDQWSPHQVAAAKLRTHRPKVGDVAIGDSAPLDAETITDAAGWTWWWNGSDYVLSWLNRAEVMLGDDGWWIPAPK